MRNLRKYLAVLLTVAMMVAAVVPVTAAGSYVYEDEAQRLYELGLFKGTATDPDEFNPDLGLTLDRQTGVVMLLRLFGLEEEALAMDEADIDAALSGFEDAKTIADWARSSVAYATDAGLIKGMSATTFGPKVALSGKMFATLILRQLGYKDPGDFDYDESVASFCEAADVDEDEFAALSSRQLTRDDLVGMSFASLKAPYNGEETTVLQKLVENNFVDEEVAVELVPDAFPVEPTPLPGTVAVSSVSFANEPVNDDVTTAKVNVVFGALPEVDPVATDFVVTQDVDGVKSNVEATVVDVNKDTKTVVLSIPAVAASETTTKNVKVSVKYKDQAEVAAAAYTLGIRGFAVTLANDNPGEGNINKGETASMLSLTLTATGEPAVVNSVTIEKLGGDDSDIASIKLYNGTTQVGKTNTSNNLSDGVVTIPTTLTVTPGTPANLIVKVTTSTGADTGATIKLSVKNITLATGNVTGLPVFSAEKFVRNVTVGGTVVFELSEDTPAAGNISAGSTDDFVEVARLKVTAEDQQAVLKTLQFSNDAGNPAQISRIRLVNAATEAEVQVSASNSPVITNINDTITANTTRIYSVQVEILSENWDKKSGKAVKLTLLNNYLITNGVSDAQRSTVVGLPISSNEMTVVDSTSMTYAYDSTSPEASKIAVPNDGFDDSSKEYSDWGATLPIAEAAPYLSGVLSLTAGSSNDITVKALQIEVKQAAGSIDDDEMPGIGILDENDTVILDPTANGGTSPTTFDPGGSEFTFDLPVTVPKGETKKLRIYAFVSGNDGAAGGPAADAIDAGEDAYQIKVYTGDSAASDGVVVGSDAAGTNYIDPLGGTITFNTMTAAASGTVTISAPEAMPEGGNTIQGADDVLVYKVKLKANQEPVLLKSGGTIKLSPKDTTSGTTIFEAGGKLVVTRNGYSETIVENATVDGTNRILTYSPTSDYKIGVGETAELAFYAKVKSDASLSPFKVSLTSATAGFPGATVVGYVSGANIAPEGTYPTSNAFTVKALGTVKAFKHTNTWGDTTLHIKAGVAGKFNPLTFTIDAQSANGNIVLTSIPVVLGGADTNADITEISIMDVSTGAIVGAVTGDPVGADVSVPVTALVKKEEPKQFAVVLTGKPADASVRTVGLKDGAEINYRAESNPNATGIITLDNTIVSGEIIADDEVVTLDVRQAQTLDAPAIGSNERLAAVTLATNGDSTHRAMLTGITFKILQSDAQTGDNDIYRLVDEDGAVLQTVTVNGADYEVGTDALAFTSLDKPCVFVGGEAKTIYVYGKIRGGETKELTIEAGAAKIQMAADVNNASFGVPIPSVTAPNQ